MNTNMNRLDADERAIRAGFSSIKVNPRRLVSPATAIASEAPSYAAKRRILPMVAAIVAVLLISTTVFAFYGGFELFLQRVNPPFAEIIEPVMTYAEDRGIRVTLLGAQRFEHTAIMYFSIQDISGENRMTRGAGFAGETTIAEAGRTVVGYVRNFGSLNMSFRHIYFDDATGTQYAQLHVRSSNPLPAELTFSTTRIAVDEEIVNGNWQIVAYLEESEAQSQEIRVENISLYFYDILFQIESIIINPISMQARFSMIYDPVEMRDAFITSYYTFYRPIPKTSYKYRRFASGFYVETAYDTIPLLAGSGLGTGGNILGVRNYEQVFWAEAPLDLEAITAIIINGERFAID